MNHAVLMRDATEADLPAIRDIYNHAVEHTTAIWNETLVDLDNRIEWFKARKAKGFPVIVAEKDGKVTGYASYGDWRAFDGYRHTVEHTIHIRESHWGAGAGRLLLTVLIDRARSQGLHAMVGAVDGDNDASVRFHERLGFVEVGRMPEVGTKFGRWLDLVLMQLIVSPGEPPA